MLYIVVVVVVVVLMQHDVSEGILFLRRKNAVGGVGGLFRTIIYYIIITLIWTRVYYNAYIII